MAKTSERLQEIISIRNIKQVEIIEKTGISKGALSSYLSGRYVPKQNNIYKLAQVLNVNPAWLMGLDVPMDPAAVSSDQDALVLSDHETKLVKAYRNASDDTQIAVCAVLGVKRDTELRTERSLTG